jgi:hypothetical protein
MEGDHNLPEKILIPFVQDSMKEVNEIRAKDNQSLTEEAFYEDNEVID